MIYYKPGVTCEVKLEESNNEKDKYLITYFKYENGGYEENDVYVSLYKDTNAVGIYGTSTGNSYLYPEQVIELKKILEKWSLK